MTWWRVLVARCRALVRPQRVRDEIEEEMRFHLEMRARANEREGMPATEAREAATRAFGSVTAMKEVAYDIRGGGWVEALGLDIGYALRMLRRQRGLSAVVIGIVAIGVGANAAILGFADRVLWRELPVRAPAELEHLNGDHGWDWFSIPSYRMLRQTPGAFSGLIARWRQASTFAVGGSPERRVVEIVSGNYFDVLRVQPALGRVLSDQDDRVSMGAPVAVVSNRYWRQRLGASDSAIGRRILIDDYPFTVVGVAPPEFFGVEVGVEPDAWIPLAMHPVVFHAHRSLAEDDWLWLDVIGRRAPGVSEPRAQAIATGAMQRFVKSAGKEQVLIQHEIRLVPAKRGLSALRGNVKLPLAVLIGVVAFVLVIVCANVATLVAVRAMARSREIGVRLALGASRVRVIRQLLIENLVLAIGGGVVGTLFAIVATRGLVHLLPPTGVPTEIDVTPDTHTLALSLLLSTVTGILFGVAPAIRAARLDIAHVIRDEGGRRSRGRRLGVRRALVLGQLAVSLVLVIGAGLFAKSLSRLASAPLGVDAENVLMARINPSLNRYTPQSASAFYHALQAEAAAIPGVRAVGTSANALLDHNSNITTLGIPGRRQQPSDLMTLLIHTVGGDFFGATGTRVLRGRALNDRDAGPVKIAIVLNESAAQHYFGDRNPVGQSVFLMGGPAVVVGLAADSKYRAVREAMPQIVYVTFDQDSTNVGIDRTIYLRTSGDPMRVRAALESVVHGLDRGLPLNDVRTLVQQQRRSMESDRVVALLSGVAGAIALLLATVGLYGLVAFDTQQRTREIGVRISLGASQGRIMKLVVRGAVGLVIGGTIGGLVLSRVFSKLIASQLYGVSDSDLTVAAAACAALSTAAFLAAFVPARRAARLNPVEALRCE